MDFSLKISGITTLKTWNIQITNKILNNKMQDN